MQNLESVDYTVQTFLFALYVFIIIFLYFSIFGLSIQTSMQNLEYLAQKMAELPLDAPETQPSDASEQK